MTAAGEVDQLDQLDGHGGEVDALPLRCAAMIRTGRGWEMCHRSDHPADEAHHVRDRSWFTDTGMGPRLRVGVPCGVPCGWPDRVVPYLGSAPGTGGGAYVTTPPRPADRGRVHRGGQGAG